MVTDETFTTGVGQVLVSTHRLAHCKFRWCVIHSPMPGPWDSWPTAWNDTRRLMERQCPHGARHPAAEEYMLHGYGALVHACCRKCQCVPNLDDVVAGRSGGGVIDGEVVDVRDFRELRELEA